MMKHLMSRAVNPHLGLAQCIKNWEEISLRLREGQRRRIQQMEIMENLTHC